MIGQNMRGVGNEGVAFLVFRRHSYGLVLEPFDQNMPSSVYAPFKEAWLTRSSRSSSGIRII